MTTAPVGVYGVVGGSASLSCIASGAPTPGLFTWFRDGTEVDVENTVTFLSETSAKSEVSREDCLNAFFNSLDDQIVRINHKTFVATMQRLSMKISSQALSHKSK